MSLTGERRAIFLKEMGVGPIWIERDAPTDLPQPVQLQDVAAEVSAPWSDSSPASSAAFSSASDFSSNAVTAQAASPDEIAQMDWMQLKSAVARCTRCDLCHSRTQTVFGVGDQQGQWLLVGEGPGRNEDAQGEPFVGPAGKLLDNMLLAIDLQRGRNAYIANIVKCRPTDASGKDRPPTPEESAACRPYLERQIALLQPTVIVALGKTAAVSLLSRDAETTVGQLRGSVQRHAGIPVVVTYHPAYLLRKPDDKSKAWRDLCLARHAYARTESST